MNPMHDPDRNSLKNRKRRVNIELQKIVKAQREEAIDIAVRRGYATRYIGELKMTFPVYSSCVRTFMKKDLEHGLMDSILRCVREEFRRLQEED